MSVVHDCEFRAEARHGASHRRLSVPKTSSICWQDITSGDAGSQEVTLVEGSVLLGGHDDLAPEPVLPPQDAHLLNRHPLGLRQEEEHVAGHHKHPEGKEGVGALLHAAHTK